MIYKTPAEEPPNPEKKMQVWAVTPHSPGTRPWCLCPTCLEVNKAGSTSLLACKGFHLFLFIFINFSLNPALPGGVD